MKHMNEMSPAAAPARFGRYKILGPLAEGGMAQVHLALKDGAEKICVLKRLRLDMTSNTVTAQRFEREANLIAQLSHPNIASVSDAGREKSCFYIAMDYIAGKDVEAMMHKLMKDGRMMPYVASIYIGLQTLKALAYAHQATDANNEPLDLVHRDLSPRNIMISFLGEIKVIDFGLARGKIDDFKTAPGMLMGTLRYISPEQAVAVPVDARSDLYTLSVLLWELLTGRLLVTEKETSSILKYIVHEDVPPISEYNPNLPTALDRVIAKGLAKEPADRWANAQEYYDALLEAAGDLSKLDPSDMGLFARQLFPLDYETSQQHRSSAATYPGEPHVKTVAQEVSLPTKTSFIIPKRPATLVPEAQEIEQSPEKNVNPQPAPTTPAFSTRVAVWLLCLAIIGSTAFIGVTFLNQFVQVTAQNESEPAETKPKTQGFRAVGKAVNERPAPELKAPQLAAPKKVRRVKKPPLRPRKTKSIVTTENSSLEALKKRALALNQTTFDKIAWNEVLEEIKRQSKELRTHSETERINRLARKGMAFQKANYFVRAIEEMEKLK